MGIDTDQVPINEAFTAALEAMAARLDALEAAGGSGGTVYIPPDTIVQTFPDGSEITYRKD